MWSTPLTLGKFKKKKKKKRKKKEKERKEGRKEGRKRERKRKKGIFQKKKKEEISPGSGGTCL